MNTNLRMFDCPSGFNGILSVLDVKNLDKIEMSSNCSHNSTRTRRQRIKNGNKCTCDYVSKSDSCNCNSTCSCDCQK